MKMFNAIMFSTCLMLAFVRVAFAAEPGGKPEKADIVVTYAQPSGAFTPIWVAYEAGLFKKYEKEFPKVKNADPKEFYDNSFVDALTKSGFLKNLGMK